MNPTKNNQLSVLQRLKIDAEINGLVRARLSVQLSKLKAVQIASRIIALLRERGVDLDVGKREREAFATEDAPDTPEQPRQLTVQFFDFDPDRKHGQRKKDNTAAVALLRQIDAGEVSAILNDEQKAVLAKYSGTGGNLVGTDGKKGSAYEYYTPAPIASGMWSLLSELGFKGGKVLDPCAGTGVFGSAAPANVAVEAVELNETSGRINQLVNGGPGYNAIVSPFEAVASRTEDEIYDAVVSNVPFGDMHARGANRKIDPKYQDHSLESYFILRSLEKLRPGGLAAFIVPPRVVSGKGGREEKLRLAASFVAEFMGAYRMPNSVFGTADADTITDVIVLRKFGRDAAGKIEELREQNAQALVDAKVLWQDYLDGDYFKGEGRRYILGEFVPKDSTKFRDVDRVVSDQSITNISRLLRKFGPSRIDWKALDALETEPIEYAEGDTMTLAGQTLQLKNGAWVRIGEASDAGRFDGLGEKLTSALDAVSARMTWAEASEYIAHMRATSKVMDMPLWLLTVDRDLAKASDAERARLWLGLLAGYASFEAMAVHADEPGFNYLEEYAVLSDTLRDVATTVNKAPTKFSREGKAAFAKAKLIYSRTDGFIAVWRGDAAAEVSMGIINADSQVRAVVYESGSLEVSVSELKRIYGEHFDPLSDDEWCVSADGARASRADDYYVGNLAEYLTRVDGEILNTAPGPLQDKLLRQREAAMHRVDVVDPTALRFNLFSPFVTIEEKAEFLRRFMNPGFAVGINNLGKPYIVYEGRTDTLEQALMSRIASYLSGNAAGVGSRSLTLQGKELPVSDQEALAMLRQIATRLNTQFDGWVKSNRMVMDRLTQTANDPARLYFNEVDDTTPMTIPGMRVERTPHGYQNAFIRKQARHFGGINGYDVGLGKTLTALAATQYVQSIGVKKKTIFTVPNTVLSKWRAEAAMAYESMDDCLFIGLDIDADGKASVDSSNYARDFHRVLENRHRKIFCTMEAFAMIPMKKETRERYEAYLMDIDSSLAGSDRKADDQRAESKRSDIIGNIGSQASSLPFFEDMGFDSIVGDEAHAYKNSKETVDFSGAKFLSVSDASARGLDMQMKAWYIRGLTPRQDGVLPLTATPITNSPLEIYSMLTLGAGEKRVHDLFLGVQGADDFMNTMCIIEEDEEVGIDGEYKSYKVFRGLQNVTLLRQAISSIITIRTAADVKSAGLSLPEADEVATPIALPKETRDRLEDYKQAYRAAKFVSGAAAKNAEPPTDAELAALERVQARFGEDVALIGHPFNLIQKMTSLIADPELDERATFYRFLAPQRATADKTIADFNKLGRVEVRVRPGPWTDESAIVGQAIIKDGDSEVQSLKIKVRAGIAPDGRIFIDSTDYRTQLEFEKLADKHDLDLDCSIPPKLAALLENVKMEEAHPRSKTGRVKQLIFCDVLSMHNKIKRVLSRHAGIASSAIVIVSGQSIKNPEDMQDIQDGFNGEADANRYRAVIGNKKVEVGVDLQQGTQANHHLTIGWTPDSQHQRNGRSVRQGNTTSRVNVYHYDADGTFDNYKRTLTSKKSDWIGAVMSRDGGNEVLVAGGLSAEQYDEMIESMGDAGKLRDIQNKAELRERLGREASARTRQVISLQTAQSQGKFVKDYDRFNKWLEAKAGEAFDLNEKLAKLEGRDTKRLKPSSALRIEEAKAAMRARLDTLLRDLDSSAELRHSYPPRAITAVDAINDPELYKYSKTAPKRRETFLNLLRSGVIRNEGNLHDEWEQEIQQATALREESLKEFVRIGKESSGAYHPRTVESFQAGKGMIFDGQPLAQGMFARLADGTLMVMNDEAKFVSIEPYQSKYVSDALTKGVLIGFESPDYDAAVAEAAKIDDANPMVREEQGRYLFSAHNADVAQRRTVETLTGRTGMFLRLPSPMFKFAINPKVRDLVHPALQRVIDAQAQVLKEWKGDTAYFSSKANIEVSGYSPNKTEVVRMVAAVANGAGVRFTPGDLYAVINGNQAQSVEFAQQYVAAYMTAMYNGDVSEVLASLGRAKSQDEIDKVLADAIRDAYPWIELDTSGGTNGLLNYQITNVALSRAAALKREAAEAEAAEAAKAAAVPVVVDPDRVPVVGKDAIGGVTVSATGRIGLYGNTLDPVTIKGVTQQVKDFIKKASDEAGERAKWYGKFGQWDITTSAWEILVTEYPEAAQRVQIRAAVK